MTLPCPILLALEQARYSKYPGSQNPALNDLDISLAAALSMRPRTLLLDAPGPSQARFSRQ
ncbi:hypothetical protein [Megalodesulfovibrio paquesii]